MLPMGIIVKRVIALGTHRVTNGPGGKLSQSPPAPLETRLHDYVVPHGGEDSP